MADHVEPDYITVEEARSWANEVGAWQRLREAGRTVWFGYDPSTGGPFVAYEGDECPVPQLYASVPALEVAPGELDRLLDLSGYHIVEPPS